MISRKKVYVLISFMFSIGLFSGCDNLNTKKDIPIQSISILDDTLSITEGQSVQLSYTVSPPDRTETYYLSTTNKFVATINGSGLISGISPGTAIIRVYNENNTIFDTCTVTVKSQTYSINENITKNGFTTCVERAFYVRTSTGALAVDASTGANIIVAQVKYTNNSSGSVYVSPIDFALTNGSIQSDYTYYSGLLYTPEIKGFTSNESMSISTGIIHTMYVVFKGKVFSTNNYSIVNDDYDYPFIVSFSGSQIQ